MTALDKKYHVQTGWNNPILRTISEKVDIIDPETRQFCQDLIKLMRKNKWVGIAAPQVGRNIRIIVTTQRETRKKEDKLVSETIMINPEIIEKSKDLIIREEACISLPDVLWLVKRHKAITVTYQDTKWNTFKKKFKDFNAVIIQHEIDHLEGILFTDKLLKTKKPSLK
jgi:peptide deformylase